MVSQADISIQLYATEKYYRLDFKTRRIMRMTEFPELYQISPMGKRILSRADTADDMFSLLSFIDTHPLLTTDEIKRYCLTQNAFKAWRQARARGYIELALPRGKSSYDKLQEMKRRIC